MPIADPYKIKSPEDRIKDPFKTRVNDGIPELTQAQDRTLYQKITEPFRAGEEESKAKALNSYELAEQYNISPATAFKYYDELTADTGMKGVPSTTELIGQMSVTPVVQMLAANPVGALVTVGGYIAIQEAESYAIGLKKNETYKAFQSKGAVDLLPEDASQLTKDVVEVVDIIVKGALVGAGVKYGPKVVESITKQTIETHNLPKKLYITGKDLKSELQTGKILPKETMEMVKELGLSGSEYKAALKEGLTIEIPTEKVSVFSDRPWFAKVKKILNVKQFEPVKTTTIASKPTKVTPERVQIEHKKPAITETDTAVEMSINAVSELTGAKAPSGKVLQPKPKLTTTEQDSISIKSVIEGTAEAESILPETSTFPTGPDAVPLAERNKLKQQRDILVDDIRFIKGKKPELRTKKDITELRAKESQLKQIDDLIESGKTFVEELPRTKPITPEGDVSTLIELRRSFVNAGKAARKAYKEGNIEGVEKQKAIMKDRLDKIREIQQRKARVQKAVKIIKKEPSSGIEYSYRAAINNIRDTIDPQSRSKGTLESRQTTRDYLEKASPDIKKNFPKKILKLLQKKTLNDFTIDELESIAAEIKTLAKMGRLKKKLQKSKRDNKHRQDVTELSESVLDGTELTKTTEPIIEKPVKGLGSKARTVNVFVKRPVRILRELDGKRDGPHERIFYDRFNRGVTKELRNTDRRYGKIENEMERFGITTDYLSVISEVNGVKLSKDAAIDIYVSVKNPKKALALRSGNNFTQEFVDAVVESLTDSDKEFGDSILADYNDPANYERVRATKIRLDDIDPGYEVNYTPIRVDGRSYNSMENELAEEILHRDAIKRGFVGGKFAIERLDVEHRSPLKLGLYEMWLEQVAKQERFVNQAETIKDLQRIISSKSYREAITQMKGEEYIDFLQGYVNTIADPNNYRTFSEIENWSVSLRTNTAVSVLAFNTLVIAKQLPSLALYLGHAKPQTIISEMARFTSSPLESIKFVHDRSPQMKHRSIERELDELKGKQRGKYRQLVKTVGTEGMKGIYLFDKIATAIGWRAVYNDNLLEVGEQKAIELADKATFETQPQAHKKDLPELYRTSEFLNWATQFTNQLNNIFNIAVPDIMLDLKTGEYSKAAHRAVGVAISAYFIWMITNQRLPENADDVTDIAVSQMINTIPLVGKNIMAGRQGYGSNTLIGQVVGGVGKAIAPNKQPLDRVYAILESLTLASGAPIVGGKRLLKSVEEESILPLLGVKDKKNKNQK